LQEPARVGIVASGGLSHFVVHEDLDRGVLKALKERDEKALLGIPDGLLQSGNSEIKNWMVAATACEHLDFEVIDYVPLRRSPAGTGAGMGFGFWA
jgi:3-O-methylgallate 3,4-dioxygenase